MPPICTRTRAPGRRIDTRLCCLVCLQSDEETNQNKRDSAELAESRFDSQLNDLYAGLFNLLFRPLTAKVNGSLILPTPVHREVLRAHQRHHAPLEQAVGVLLLLLI